MTDQGFPNTHTTTTGVQQTGSKSGIHLDLSYLHTTDGRIKCGECALNLLGFICILSSAWNFTSRGNWFNTVAMGGFWFSGIMLAFFIFHVPENLKVIPWVKVEFVFCALWTFFYLIAASLAANLGHDEGMAAAAVEFLPVSPFQESQFPHSPVPNLLSHWLNRHKSSFSISLVNVLKVISFFGFCAMLLYGYDAYTKFCKIKEERNTVRTINMPPSNNPPPPNPTY